MPGSDRGFLVTLENTSDHRFGLATRLATGIKAHNDGIGISLAVPPGTMIPACQRPLFDQIIDIPWYDASRMVENWSIMEKWKLPYVSPYRTTIGLDDDMIVESDLSFWWDYLETLGMDVVFPTHAIDANGDVIDRTSEVFRRNKIPFIRSSIIYFQKTDGTFGFFDLVRSITWNWQSFFEKFFHEQFRPTVPDADAIFSLALKIWDEDNRHYRPRCLPTFIETAQKDVAIGRSFPVRYLPDV